MSKEYYKKRLIDLRKYIAQEREAKKRDNESYARQIKGTTNPTTKASLRKNKIDKAASHDRRIEEYKHQIELTRDRMKRA